MFGNNTYLANLLEKGKLESSKEEILEEIEKNGIWKEYQEWRMAVTAEISIKNEDHNDEKWFKVNVNCDYEFNCLCPTIERAIEMAGLYQQLIMNLDAQVGWPSWVSASQMEVGKSGT